MSTTDIGLLPTSRQTSAKIIRKKSKQTTETSEQSYRDKQRPKVFRSKTSSDATCPSQHFPLRHVSGREGPNTQAGYFNRISPGVTSSSASRPTIARTSDTQEDYDSLVRLSWGLLPVTSEVKSRFGFSGCRCVCFWFDSGHLTCDTAAILTPRPSSSIRN